MNIIETLTTTETLALLTWCKSQPLTPEIFTGRQTCRQKKWWGIEAEFYFSASHCYTREPIESDSYLAELRDRIAPNSNSILLYHYEVGGEIGEHLDKQCFHPEVTMINLVDATPDLFGNYPRTKFRWDKTNFFLENGEVVKFNSRIIHSVPKLKTARYSLQFRVVR